MVSILVQNIPDKSITQEIRYVIHASKPARFLSALCLLQNTNALTGIRILDAGRVWWQCPQMRQCQCCCGSHQGGVCVLTPWDLRVSVTSTECEVPISLPGISLNHCLPLPGAIWWSSNVLSVQEKPLWTPGFYYYYYNYNPEVKKNSFKNSFRSWTSVKCTGANWYGMLVQMWLSLVK